MKKRPEYLRNCRGMAILFFLATALIIAVELLFVRTLMVDYTSLIVNIRNATFLSAILLIAGSAVFHRTQIHFWVRQFIADCKLRKGERK